MAGKFVIVMAVLAGAMGACSSSSHYIKNSDGTCSMRDDERAFGIRFQRTDTLAKKCPKGAAK